MNGAEACDERDPLLFLPYEVTARRELRTTKEVLRKHRPVRTLLLDFSAFRAKMCLFVYLLTIQF